MIKVVQESLDDIKSELGIDPFKGLTKVNVEGAVPDGYVTDGWGSVYKIPARGVSEPVIIDDHTKVRYSFGDNQLQYILDGELAGSEHIQPSEWFDNPEYWATKLADMYSQNFENTSKSITESDKENVSQAHKNAMSTVINKCEHYVNLMDDAMRSWVHDTDFKYSITANDKAEITEKLDALKKLINVKVIDEITRVIVSFAPENNPE